MADAYDAYRLNAAPVGYGDVQGSPQQFYAPSSSVWGNYRDSAGFGNPTLGALTAFTPFGALSGLGTNIFRGLRDGDMDWKNVASFGVSGAKDKQEQARRARIAAVDKWRYDQNERLQGLLGQYGGDAARDLSAQLKQAIYSGGEMGDMSAIKNNMAKYQQQVQQYLLGRQRAQQARQVDAMYADPRRLAEREHRLSAGREQSLQDLAESFRIGTRDNAFNQARRGMLGGSTDVEKQGQLQRGRNVAAQGIQAGFDARAQQYRLGDAQQRQQLLGLIYGDNPEMAASLGRTIEGLNAQGQLTQENAALRQQQSALNTATSTGYSQAGGSLLSGISQPLGYYIEHSGGGS